MDLRNLGEMMKLAQEAKKAQKEQESYHQRQIELLEEISRTLISILKKLEEKE